MKWTEGGTSEDVEDRRGEGGGGGGFGGRHISIGGFLILLILSVVFKRNFFALLDGTSATTSAPTAPRGPVNQSPTEDREVKFVSFVLDDVQSVWTREMQSMGKGYPHAKLVLFRDQTESGCGAAQTASGPFYCPEDQKVYIDLAFFDELASRFQAPGELAQAYVLAHEVGHHVQNLLGIAPKVRRAEEENPGSANALSVRLELQADCLAGVWAKTTEQRGLLEKGDVESALAAAAAVGDDRLQRMARGRVQPETFTHGSSKDRVGWFTRGMQSGTIDGCDTFGRR
jgi:predicted metalloprotease